GTEHPRHPSDRPPRDQPGRYPGGYRRPVRRGALRGSPRDDADHASPADPALAAVDHRHHRQRAGVDPASPMTATEKFQIVAAVAAGLATLGFLIPGRTPQSAAPRHLGSLGVLVASWFMLGGSLISRHDASRGWDRISSLPRI